MGLRGPLSVSSHNTPSLPADLHDASGFDTARTNFQQKLNTPGAEATGHPTGLAFAQQYLTTPSNSVLNNDRKGPYDVFQIVGIRVLRDLLDAGLIDDPPKPLPQPASPTFAHAEPGELYTSNFQLVKAIQGNAAGVRALYTLDGHRTVVLTETRCTIDAMIICGLFSG
ncbi:hypothetical protein BDV28DRAFT_149200 [Aspergillus coremiiformis]|uniref:Uncharacterized protein n=1 Tax=Aspergillus coremiiformis TaxID=138285 RepID=A0A5N6Z4D1_9EURO|nr:hypothetical protein BDV28DRAFT_149200 [Aspergillus coremiiformis]